MNRSERQSNLELLRILCMLFIIADHLAGQGGIGLTDTLPHALWYAAMGSGSRVACDLFVIIGAWFLCEQPFRTQRVLALWLGLWLYTVPVTVICRFLPGCEVGLGTLRWAMFPISTGQLWFISSYLLLLLLTPLLNHLLHSLPRATLRATLLALAVPMAGYSTLFGEDGAASGSLFVFGWLYLLTGYLRLYPANRLARQLEKRPVQLALGLGIPAALAVGRAVLFWRSVGGKPMQYLEYWRTALGAAPNLLAALALFFLFKSLPLGCRPGINRLSAATLGVYILHQVPAFHDFLWNGIFRAAAHPGSAGYSLFVIAATFVGCAAVDRLRERLIMRPLLNSRPLQALCRRGNALVNGAEQP